MFTSDMYPFPPGSTHLFPRDTRQLLTPLSSSHAHLPPTLCVSQLSTLLGELRANLHLVFRVGESVALVDTMLAFATFVRSSGGYCRPKIAESAPLVLKRCRHPLLEKYGDVDLVPNDVAITHATNLQASPRSSPHPPLASHLTFLCPARNLICS